MDGWVDRSARKEEFLAGSLALGGFSSERRGEEKERAEAGEKYGEEGKRGGREASGEESVGVLTCSHFAPRYEKEYE